MTKPWWGWEQTVNYLRANYPCGYPGPDARYLIPNLVLEGTLRTRYSAFDDPIQSEVKTDEWRRMETGEVRIEGTEIGPDRVEFEPSSVQKICISKPKANAGGRPPRYDYEGALIHLAAYIYTDGFRTTKEDLFQEMRKWFTENGPDDGGPDSREIQKRVDLFYEKVFAR